MDLQFIRLQSLIELTDEPYINFIVFVRIDRVFRGESSTRQVYDDGVKEVALSVVSGINCKYNMNVLAFCLSRDEMVFNNVNVFQQVFLRMGRHVVERHTQ